MKNNGSESAIKIVGLLPFVIGLPPGYAAVITEKP